MKFACLVYVDAALIGALSEEAQARMVDASVEHDWRMRKAGHLILAQPLQEPDRAVTIRVRAGRMSSTDGPFAETKEHLGGFFLIEAGDVDEAVRIAAESPMAEMGSIEVRPFLEQTHSGTGEARPQLQQ